MSNHKVDISEVDKYSNDFKEASEEIRSNLDKVKEHIDSINNMESFSGKAAKEAKGYFNEMHLTILESFRGLFDDLDENMKQHLQTFATEVDSSDSTVIESNYLQDVKEDINEIYEDLEKQDEIFHDTIEDVADITSATSPDFSEVNEWKRKSVEKIKELDEDLVSFTSTDDEIDVKETMNQIETVMNNAKTSEGKARFADFKGASDNSELKKLMEYNDGKQEEKKAEIEEAKDVRDNALQSDIESSSKEIANILYKKFENGDITFDQYMIMMDTAKALPYIKEPTKFYNQVMKQVIDNASDISVTEGISSGLENGGEYTKDIIKEIRYHAAKWGQNEKNSFVMYSSDSAEKSSKFIKGADI